MTICAPSTPSGGAIGIIRISGPESINIANSIFSRDILTAKGFTMHYGHITAPVSEASASAILPSVPVSEVSPSAILSSPVPCESSQGPIDDVIISISRSPHSYTGEDTVEISHHGSPYIQQTILQLLISQGCQMAQPGEFTQRAFLNGKMDLSQAEAVADLIASTNAASHRVAMTQMRGGFSHKLAELRNQLLEMTSLLELELDFSEEDVEFADRQKLLLLARQIEQEIKHLSSSFATGNAIKNGIPVAIIGAPNVGKSTLLNQLLHEDRAIVSDIQGTTRDIIEDTFTIQGLLFRFIDTAGIRHTDDTIEKMGIERSLRAAEKAQIIILMREPGVDFPDIFQREDQTVIEVTNKSETFQALDGIGLSWLEDELVKAVPQLPEDGVIVTNLRHKQVLDLALTDIRRSIESLEFQQPGDLISEDLRQCITHLGEIVGQITNDEVLGNIFSHFCIGK